MNGSIAVIGRILRKDMLKKTRKRPKNNQLHESEQDFLSLPHRKACQENTACADRSHMTLTAATLEQTLYIALQLVVNTYH